ncbi:Complement C5 [Anabarilius grahami]|uniref:Complement C5 n=1 Tax=Anabarilius grahami TaxID=495550 RepID=A0A3N0Y8M8_ANAGA|nr:Complement C5 [Anabarilius grahami]
MVAATVKPQHKQGPEPPGRDADSSSLRKSAKREQSKQQTNTQQCPRALWICVSDEKIQVSQDISVDVPLPYSMVRGEQIELRGSVYNQRSSKTWFSVTLTATEGVCVFHGTQQEKNGKPNEIKGQIDGRSVALVTFYIMALEAGTHTLTFTLTTKWGGETVVKKLKVVPEGIRKEIQIGGRIDPNGVFGTSMRKLELKHVIPPNIAPKSTVDRILTINGEVLGELLSIINNPEGLKQLTNLPRGNAEMELMGLLPIYYVYHYLEKTEKWDILGKESAASEKELKRKMQAGVTSIMSYKLKNEYAFSMWSNKDKSASTWVTALIAKTLADMHEYVSLESEVLINTIYWLIKNRQNGDGSFYEKSQTNPIKLMGAGADVTEKTVFLTSFVMIGIKNALKVPKVNIQAFKDALDHAAQYLSSKSKKTESLYVRAIASYALTLVDIHSMPAVGLYEKIKQQAQVKGNPATVRFWEDSKPKKDSLKPSDVTAKTVETTVYVLLNTLVRGDSTYAKPILNWLTQDQRFGGGFHSTQDSILTLEALTKYSILASQATLDMVVDIEYKTKGDISRIKITQQKPVVKPIEVTKNDDIIIKTAMSSGVSFAKYQNGLESMISNYEIIGDQVILQIDSIPSKDFYCVGFRIQEEFETGMTRASVFRVYEFYDQENKCMKFYQKQSRKLLRLCEGDQCQCMAEQTDDLKTDSEIDFVKKATCTETNFEVGKQYLIMTAESIKIKVDRAYKYKFPLDSHAWVDWWPLESDCRNDACKQYTRVLDDFEFDFVLSGCD